MTTVEQLMVALFGSAMA
jgi:hypothetical protein